jgi:hypothetical protein
VLSRAPFAFTITPRHQVGLLFHTENVIRNGNGFRRDSHGGDFTDFDVQLTDVTLTNSSIWHIYAENASGFKLTNVSAVDGTAGVTIRQVDNFHVTFLLINAGTRAHPCL